VAAAVAGSGSAIVHQPLALMRHVGQKNRQKANPDFQ